MCLNSLKRSSCFASEVHRYLNHHHHPESTKERKSALKKYFFLSQADQSKLQQLSARLSLLIVSVFIQEIDVRIGDKPSFIKASMEKYVFKYPSGMQAVRRQKTA